MHVLLKQIPSERYTEIIGYTPGVFTDDHIKQAQLSNPSPFEITCLEINMIDFDAVVRLLTYSKLLLDEINDLRYENDLPAIRITPDYKGWTKTATLIEMLSVHHIDINKCIPDVFATEPDFVKHFNDFYDCTKNLLGLCTMEEAENNCIEWLNNLKAFIIKYNDLMFKFKDLNATDKVEEVDPLLDES